MAAEATTRPEIAPRRPIESNPPRRPHSVRRTSTLDGGWPEGFGGRLTIEARARDLLTRVDTRVVAECRAYLELGPERDVRAITVEPDRPGAQALIGARGGGGFRRALNDALPGEQQAGSLAYFLLDDVAGVSLVAGFAFSQQPQTAEMANHRASRRTFVAGICSGYRPGAPATVAREAGGTLTQNVAVGPDLDHDDDALAWHPLPERPEVGLRRRRRIDVWIDGDIHLDAMFRDATWTPEGTETIVHEYAVTASISADTGELLEVTADPRVLPYGSCPAAADEVGRMIGTSLGTFRASVLEALPGVLGCTHLNDMLRSLGEVPQLVALLRRGD